MRHWTVSNGKFKPSFANGAMIETELDNSELIEAIILEHMSTPEYQSVQEYAREDFSDEIRIDVYSGGRRRYCLINLQFEGES